MGNTSLRLVIKQCITEGEKKVSQSLVKKKSPTIRYSSVLLMADVTALCVHLYVISKSVSASALFNETYQVETIPAKQQLLIKWDKMKQQISRGLFAYISRLRAN